MPDMAACTLALYSTPDCYKGHLLTTSATLYQVLHRGRGSGSSDYQTLSQELSEEKCKRIRPMYGSRSYLALETRPEDDPAIPFRVCPIPHHLPLEAESNDALAGLAMPAA